MPVEELAVLIDAIEDYAIFLLGPHGEIRSWNSGAARIMGYAAEGVAFQATDADTLGSILSGIFRGTLRVDRQKYSTFIEKYAYRIDGRVVERCVKAITGMMNDEC